MHDFAVWFYCSFCFWRSAWKLKPVFNQLNQFRESGVRGSVTFLHAVMEPPRLLPELALALPWCVSGTWYIRGDSKLLFVPQNTKENTFSESSAYSERKKHNALYAKSSFQIELDTANLLLTLILFPCWFHFCIWWNRDDLVHSEYKIVTHHPPRTVDGHICMSSSRVDTFS